MTRYFLDQDQSFHWYIVDASRRREWEAWVNLSEDDPKAWNVPDFAEALSGGCSHVEFENPSGHD